MPISRSRVWPANHGLYKQAALVIAGGDVRGGAGDGALRESLLDLQQRQRYRNRPLDQGHGTRRSQCTLP